MCSLSCSAVLEAENERGNGVGLRVSDFPPCCSLLAGAGSWICRFFPSYGEFFKWLNERVSKSHREVWCVLELNPVSLLT